MNEQEITKKGRKDTYLTRKLNPLLHRRIGLQRFPLNFIQQIRPSSQKLVMRKLPRLRIAGRSLRSGSLANSFSDGLLRVNL